MKPKEKKVLEIPFKPKNTINAKETFLNIYLKLTADKGLLTKGYILASEQFKVQTRNQTSASIKEIMSDVSYAENDSVINITGKSFSLFFNKSIGILSSFKFDQNEFIQKGPVPNFRRAPTDNDIGNGMYKRCKPWFVASETRMPVSIITRRVDPATVQVEVTYSFPDSTGRETIAYTVHGNAEVVVNVKMDPGKKNLPELPRFGLNVQLRHKYNSVEWLGRGPYENYWDSSYCVVCRKVHL